MPIEEFVEVVDMPNQGLCARLTKQAAANTLFYHDCATADQDWAWLHLAPMPVGPSLERFHLTRFWETSIPKDFIITTDDRSHTVAMDNLFLARLGRTTAYSIASSHSPFLSRPADTARLLNSCIKGGLD
jgi:hypothetical protein